MADKKKNKRVQDLCIMAVHKKTHKFFGGKAGGTHVGYNKKQYLKSAMSLAGAKHDDYYYVSMSFNSIGLPELTLLEGKPEHLYYGEDFEDGDV